MHLHRTIPLLRGARLRRYWGIALLPVLGASPALAAPTSNYTLVWADEFDGSSLDLTHWVHDQRGLYRKAFNTPEAVSVANGRLSIATYTADDGRHHTGFIGTRFRYQPLYGHMEARIRFNDAPGSWSAFWMFNGNVGKSNRPRTDGTEPDIVEHRAVDRGNVDVSKQVTQALHWDGYNPGRTLMNTPSLPKLDPTSGFHTYAMTWTPTSQTFSVDGVAVWKIIDAGTTDPLPPAAPVSRISQFFYLTTEVQDYSWAGNVPPGGYGPKETSPYRMDVDYVRVYQQGPPVPAAPVGVTVRAAANGCPAAGCLVDWDLTDNAPYYKVKRSTIPGGPYETIATTGIQATGAAYLDTTALPGQAYYYVVSAVNGPKEGPNSLEVSTRGADVPAGARSGVWAARAIVNGTATWRSLIQPVGVVPGTAYEAGVWLRGSGTVRLLALPATGGATIAYKYLEATPAWTYHRIAFDAGTNELVRFKLEDSSAVAGSVSVDDAFLGEAGGANLLANADFESGAASWTISNAATWSVDAFGPASGNAHGGLQSARGVMSGSASFAYLIQTVDVAPDTLHEAGVWIKGGGKTRLLVYPSTSAPPIAYVTIRPTAEWTYYSLLFSSGANTQVRLKFDDESTSPSTMLVDDLFLGEPGGANLLVNPDFERGSVGWELNYIGKVWGIGQW